MTASVTGRKRCGCGQYKTPLANGTMPRHTAPDLSRPCVPLNRVRKTCLWVGKFPPADKRSAEQELGRPAKVRGGHRGAKCDANRKARYRRNAAGGYTR